VLYCPKCGTEYREGYSSCADCHVLLSREKPSDEDAPEPGDTNRDPFCSFWQGTDARVLGELSEVLEEAGILYKVVRREDRLFNRMDLPKLLLGVPASLYETAEQAVGDAFTGRPLLRDTDGLVPKSLEKKLDFDQDEPDMELTDSSPQDDRRTQQSSTLLMEWFPADATVEAWKGHSSDSWMIEMSLQENEIRFRSETQDYDRQLFVLPQDEPRAREIIREIVESSPLE
jgi:hypothetical protein